MLLFRYFCAKPWLRFSNMSLYSAALAFGFPETISKITYYAGGFNMLFKL